MRTVWLNAWYFPFVELLSVFGDRDRARVRRLPHVRGRDRRRHALRLHRLPAELLRPGPAAVPGLQHLPRRDGCAQPHLRRHGHRAEARRRAGAPRPRAIEGHVELDNVRFGYGDGPDVLHGLELVAEPARPSRSSAHRRGQVDDREAPRALLRPPRRHGRIDGHDVRTVQAATLRRQLGIVPQESFLFAGTIAENIAYARPDATRGEVEDAARAVGADRFIEAARRLRHRGRRTRQRALGGRAPARRARPRVPRRPAHPGARRGDVERRHRDRAADRSGDRDAARGAHLVRRRAPAPTIRSAENRSSSSRMDRVVEQGPTRICSHCADATRRCTRTGPAQPAA